MILVARSQSFHKPPLPVFLENKSRMRCWISQTRLRSSLFGLIGVGKYFVALTLLHHSRTHAKFGGNRHFMHFGDLSNSLEAFLERLSDAIHTNGTTDVIQLRSHVGISPPFILLLYDVDSILDP